MQDKLGKMIETMTAAKEGAVIEARLRAKSKAGWYKVTNPSWDWERLDYRIWYEKRTFIPWKNVHEDYNYYFRGKYGYGFFSKTEPCIVGDEWHIEDITCSNPVAGLIVGTEKWQSSLIARPQLKKPEKETTTEGKVSERYKDIIQIAVHLNLPVVYRHKESQNGYTATKNHIFDFDRYIYYVVRSYDLPQYMVFIGMSYELGHPILWRPKSHRLQCQLHEGWNEVIPNKTSQKCWCFDEFDYIISPEGIPYHY